MRIGAGKSALSRERTIEDKNLPTKDTKRTKKILILIYFVWFVCFVGKHFGQSGATYL